MVERLRQWQPTLKIVAIIETAKRATAGRINCGDPRPGTPGVRFTGFFPRYQLQPDTRGVSVRPQPHCAGFAHRRFAVADRWCHAGDQRFGGGRRDSHYARSLGFGAKLCIHPAQLDTVQRAFLPDSRQLAWADRVMSAVATGSHAVQVDGEMVDLPLIEHAQRLLDVARQHTPIARVDAC